MKSDLFDRTVLYITSFSLDLVHVFPLNRKPVLRGCLRPKINIHAEFQIKGQIGWVVLKI